MEYQLQLKPFERKDGVKYKVIQITDIALHTTPHRPTSIGKRIRQAFARNEPGRIYGPLERAGQHGAVATQPGSGPIEIFRRDAELIRMIREEERKGYRVLISFPKTGVPVVAGADTFEFIQSKNGKRVLRGLAKKQGGV